MHNIVKDAGLGQSSKVTKKSDNSLTKFSEEKTISISAVECIIK